MPVLNLDVVAPMPIEVRKVGEDGEPQVWKLRADVPSSTLVRCFYLLELEQHRPVLDLDPNGPIDFEDVKAVEAAWHAHEEQEEEEVLGILADIWRWSYPGTPAEELRALLSPAERRQIVQAFFLILLARCGKLPSAPTSASSSTDSPSPSQAEKVDQVAEKMDAHLTRMEQSVGLPPLENSLTSKGQDSTHSATRSPAGSSQRRKTPAKAIKPRRTTTASGIAASIY